MKKSTLKKVFALMLALVLTFAMSVPAFAATQGDGDDDYTITITPGDYTDVTKTDRYKAYEIFTGRLTDAEPPLTDEYLDDYSQNQLADIKWGDDIDVTKFVAALVADVDDLFDGAFADLGSFTGDAQAVEVARILSEKATLEEGENDAEKIAAAEDFAKNFAIVAQKNLKTDASPVSSTYNETSKKFSIVVDKPGYYLIADEPGENVAKGDIISEHILQVVRDRQIKVKSDTPSVDKEIVTGYGGYEIGETITFRLTGTLAENFNNYTNPYLYKFIDTMTKGLTLVEDSINVEVWSVDETGALKAKVENVTVTKGTTAANGNYTVTVDKIDTDGDDVDESTQITIAFDDLREIENLDAKHVIVVTYNAYINTDAIVGTPEINKVKLEFSNDPYHEDSTTETPEIKVAVETFEIDVIKTDSVTAEALAGVKFKLYKVEAIAEPTPEGPTTKNVYGNFTGSNGTYTLNTEDSWTETKDDATELITIAGGILNIKGLGDGTYYLEEVEPYNGYNTLPGPIEITITATYYKATDNEVIAGTKVEGEVKTVTTTVTINGETSVLAQIDATRAATSDPAIIPLDVKNVPASSLPSTGGIGNYVFYIGGVLLIAVAVAFFLVSKKKSSKEAE